MDSSWAAPNWKWLGTGRDLERESEQESQALLTSLVGCWWSVVLRFQFHNLEAFTGIPFLVSFLTPHGHECLWVCWPPWISGFICLSRNALNSASSSIRKTPSGLTDQTTNVQTKDVLIACPVQPEPQGILESWRQWGHGRLQPSLWNASPGILRQNIASWCPNSV